ncbi:hypothetical protein [Shinella sumterensis]|uniref:Uncharacterized protein n=1 Tax=Shinella sumterensis TaxID=1967501 RepID=A0AA50HA70_9HYPH|nr:hypothetical protein [Shinella sumterensis]WLS01028.1 hypothetical protein Q9313_26905 [Shinella sumterensis]WLS11811.1 hypothetical protein Q9314_27665 [Shinella sumterensis]
MRDINFLRLYADASGLRIMLMANRLTCATDRERTLHDWVERILAEFIAFTRSALEAERRVAFNLDPEQIADLGEDLHNHHANYEYYWCEEGGYDLWDVVPLEMKEFRGILGQIHRSLRIFLSAWDLVLPAEDPLMEVSPPGERDPSDEDEERYEDLFGVDDDEEISDYELLHGRDED